MILPDIGSRGEEGPPKDSDVGRSPCTISSNKRRCFGRDIAAIGIGGCIEITVVTWSDAFAVSTQK